MASESIYGVWWTPDNPGEKMPGHLTWEPPRSPLLEVLEPPESFGVFGRDETVPIIVGDVARFGWMTLLNCEYGGMHWGGLTTTRTLRVGQAISRVRLDHQSDRFFRRVEMHVPALALLLGPEPIRPKTRLSGRSREARLTLDDRRRTWRAEGIDVQAWYCWRANWNELGVDLQMVPQVYLSSATSRPFSYWFDEWLVPFNVFLQVATARLFRPRSVSLWTKKGITPEERSSDRLRVWAAGIDPDAATDLRRTDVQLSYPLVSIEQLEDISIHDALKRTKRFANDYEVFWSLLAFVLSDAERPMRNRYLDVIAALEAYDSRKHGLGPIDVERYKAERKSVLAAVGDPTANKFLKRWLRGRPEFSLEDRLRRSAKATGTTWEIDATTMARVRNDIAHGNAHPDGYLLRNCFAQALEAARKLALAEMGLG